MFKGLNWGQRFLIEIVGFSALVFILSFIWLPWLGTGFKAVVSDLFIRTIALAVPTALALSGIIRTATTGPALMRIRYGHFRRCCCCSRRAL